MVFLFGTNLSQSCTMLRADLDPANKISFQWKADPLRIRLSKVRARIGTGQSHWQTHRQTDTHRDRQTDATERITRPPLWVMKNKVAK